MWQSYFTGFAVSGGLILAIGAQNAHVLAQSLRREHHLQVALLCIVCDAIMISAGVLGVTRALGSDPWALSLIRYAGVGFLLVYGLLALRRALTGSGALAALDGNRKSLKVALLTTLAVTWLNPHAYLDTLVLVGGVGAQQDRPLIFVWGAVSASITWFLTLALGGAALSPWLSRPAAWRGIDGTVAVIMFVVAFKLGTAAWT